MMKKCPRAGRTAGGRPNHNQGGPTMTHDTAAVLCQRADEEAQVAWCPVCRAHRGQACLGPMRNVGAHSARLVLRLAELEAVEDSEGSASLA